MCTFSEMAERWVSVETDIITDVSELMEENKEQIIALNTDQLYEKGEGADGQKLPAYRNAAYAKMKEAMRGTRITDGYLTGALQAGMNLTVNNGLYAIDSPVPYAEELRRRRGYSEIFGLTDESKQAAWSIVREPYVHRIAEKTGCGVGE